MKNVLLLNKKEGETPLQALEAFRRRNKKYKKIKMTYAGRLDPMASGLLLVLAGEETKNKEKYLSLDKEYEFEVLFGFATDTYDILGKVISSFEYYRSQEELEKKIKQHLKYFSGRFKQKYPIFSSKTVKGMQLFEYARSGMEVKLPEREVFVKSLKLLKLKKIAGNKLFPTIKSRISKVKGDFRQKEILRIWKRALKKIEKNQKFFIAGFKMKCGSGTYVRGIANTLGEKLGIPALAFSIKRVKIGKWVEEE